MLARLLRNSGKMTARYSSDLGHFITARDTTSAMPRLPPETVEIPQTRSRRPSSARRKRTPEWNIAALIPPPERARPMEGVEFGWIAATRSVSGWPGPRDRRYGSSETKSADL